MYILLGYPNSFGLANSNLQFKIYINIIHLQQQHIRQNLTKNLNILNIVNH